MIPYTKRHARSKIEPKTGYHSSGQSPFVLHLCRIIIFKRRRESSLQPECLDLKQRVFDCFNRCLVQCISGNHNKKSIEMIG